MKTSKILTEIKVFFIYVAMLFSVLGIADMILKGISGGDIKLIHSVLDLFFTKPN
jgi:hypothetical protein